MNEVFIVIKIRDDCGEIYRSNRIVAATKKIALAYIEEQTKANAIRRENIVKYQSASKVWEDANKIVYPDTPLKEIKKWRAGIHMNEITQEMRDERNATKEYNNQVVKELGKVREEWQKRKDQWTTEFLNSIGVPEENHSKIQHGSTWEIDETTYEIEKITFRSE